MSDSAVTFSFETRLYHFLQLASLEIFSKFGIEKLLNSFHIVNKYTFEKSEQFFKILRTRRLKIKLNGHSIHFHSNSRRKSSRRDIGFERRNSDSLRRELKRETRVSRACIATHCLGALPSDLDRIVYTHTAPLYVIPPPLAPVSRAITLAE